MPGRARFCSAGYPIHVIQRGNNRQAIFTSDADLAAYAHWLAEGAERFCCCGSWRNGTLFEGRFKTCIVQENRYLLTCLRYIELNPVRAGLVKDPGDYHWSSYRSQAFGVRAGLWSPHYLYRDLAKTEQQRQQTWRALINETLDIEVLAKARHSANTGLVLGTESFREQVQRLRN